jgi:ribosomal protein L19E
MTQDVRQWLAEIKALQQQLAELRLERDEAYTSAANWRKLYETEAKQRRTEAAIAKQTIEQLQTMPQPQNEAPSNEGLHDREQELAQIKTLEVAKARLVEALSECDRLTQLVEHQHAEHVKAKEALTTALGDTMAALTQERGRHNGNGSKNGKGRAGEEGSKTPLPELPPSDPARSLV